ncbi:MAG: site-2 protease family protein, partial [Actinomycetes bacterium]
YPPAKANRKDTGRWASTIAAARSAHLENMQPGDESRMFYQLPVYKRIIVMLGGPFMNLVLGTVLMMVALVGIGVVQPTSQIDSIATCFVNDQPSETCDSASVKSPAAIAGLQAKDKIVSINGQNIGSWRDAQSILQANPERELILGVKRDAKTITIAVTPLITQRNVIDPATGNYKVDSEGKPLLAATPTLGIVLGSARQPVAVGTAFSGVGQALGQVGQMIINLPAQLALVAEETFGGGERSTNGPISIVGVGSIAGQIGSNAQVTWQDKLSSGLLMLSSLNFALFVFNLIPLLPLDGGHVAGGIYEAVKRGIYRLARRKDPGPADTARLMPLTYAVWILLMASSLLLIVADVVNPIKYF